MYNSPEGATKTPQTIDIGRRRLLFGAPTFAGTILAADVLIKTERAYAAVKSATNFREIRKLRYPARSPSLETQLPTKDLSHGETISVQGAPTPDLQATKTARDIQSERLSIQKQQTDNTFAFVTDVVVPLSTAIAIGTLAYTIFQGRRDHKEQETTRIQQEVIRQADLNRANQERREDQRIDREKRDEDRFQAVVAGLGSKDIEARTGAAIMLQTFLDTKYKESYQRFYQQIFDLTVAYLRLREVEPHNPHPDPFNQALLQVFQDSVPLMIEMLNLEALAAKSGLHNALYYMHIQGKFMNAREVHLDGADFFAANLRYISLLSASLTYVNLNGAVLEKANLIGANLNKSDLSVSFLTGIDLSNANLGGANLRAASLTDALLFEANLEGANPEDAVSLESAKMWGVKGLSEDQINKCKAKKADFDTLPFRVKTQ